MKNHVELTFMTNVHSSYEVQYDSTFWIRLQRFSNADHLNRPSCMYLYTWCFYYSVDVNVYLNNTNNTCFPRVVNSPGPIIIYAKDCFLLLSELFAGISSIA